MRLPVENLAQHGVIKDIKDHLLPPNAWTDARNVRFFDGKVQKMLGSAQALGTPGIAPYWLLHTYTQDKESAWLYPGLAKIYSFASAAHNNITRAVGGDYSANADLLWNGGVLGGIAVLNNSIDVPQQWVGTTGATLCADLSNWNSNWRARVVRPFKNFLFACDVTESGTRYIHRVRISHPAVPGAVPPTWDETDPTKDAIVRELSDVDAGGCLDAVPLRDLMVIYKERATHGFQFIGGVLKWRSYAIFDKSGILDDHCAHPFDNGTQHFVMTGEDVIVHNGQQRRSVIDKRTRRWLLANLSSTKFHRSFTVPHSFENENLFCFPTEGSDWPNVALHHNWIDDTITIKDIDQASFIANGIIADVTPDPWDSDTNSWDSDTTPWNILENASYLRSMLQAKPTQTRLLHLEHTQQFQGVNYRAIVERTGLDMLAIDRYGKLVRDKDTYKLIKGVWIHATGAPIQVEVGTQQEIDGGVTWSAPMTFTPGVDKKVDFTVFGKLFGFRFYNEANESFSLEGYEPDVEPLGTF